MFNLCSCHGQLAPFPLATCQSAFDVIGSKAHKIAGHNLDTIGNEESCLCATSNLSPKLCHQSYPTDNHSILIILM